MRFYVRAHLFYMCEFPLRKRQPSHINSIRQPSILMKNTSLLVLLGNAKRTPSVEPAERKRARFRALDGTQVIGLKALIASYNQAGKACEASKKQKRVNFLAFFSLLFSNSKSDTTQLSGGSLCTFMLILLSRVYIS